MPKRGGIGRRLHNRRMLISLMAPPIRPTLMLLQMALPLISRAVGRAFHGGSDADDATYGRRAAY